MAFTDPQVSQIAEDLSRTFVRMRAIEGRMTASIITMKEETHGLVLSHDTDEIVSVAAIASEKTAATPHFIFSTGDHIDGY